jgi:hypothetical protein
MEGAAGFAAGNYAIRAVRVWHRRFLEWPGFSSHLFVIPVIIPFVIPAQAGIQKGTNKRRKPYCLREREIFQLFWVPACAGTTA